MKRWLEDSGSGDEAIQVPAKRERFKVGFVVVERSEEEERLNCSWFGKEERRVFEWFLDWIRKIGFRCHFQLLSGIRCCWCAEKLLCDQQWPNHPNSNKYCVTAVALSPSKETCGCACIPRDNCTTVNNICGANLPMISRAPVTYSTVG